MYTRHTCINYVLLITCRSYGWWSSDSKVAMHLETLKKAIPSRVQVDTQNAYFAGYDSPWTVLDRHNEVWLVEV